MDADAQIVGIVIQILFVTVCLWLGSRITRAPASFFIMLMIAAVSWGVGLIPMYGLILSSVVMYILLWKMAQIPFFPDAVLLVVVANLIATYAASVVLSRMFG